MDDALKPFIPAPTITKIVRDFHLATSNADAQIVAFLALPPDKKLQAAYEIAGPGPHQAAKAKVLMQKTLADFQAAQAAEQAKMTEEYFSHGLAECFRERLDLIGMYTKDPAGVLLVNAKGANPEWARFMFEPLPVTEVVKDQLIPLLADEFRRLASIPNLVLPHARLEVDATKTEIRLYGVAPHFPVLGSGGGRSRARPH